MKIAVVGTGHVGGTLGQRWRAADHEVVYGSRAGSGMGPGGVPVMPVGDAVTGADVVVLAVPGGAVGEVVVANAAALADKVVIDASNRFGEPEVNSRAVIAAAAPGPGMCARSTPWAGRISPTRPKAPCCSSPPTRARARWPRN